MAVNLLEPDRLVYHDEEARTISIKVPVGSRCTRELIFTTFEVDNASNPLEQRTIVRRDAVETLVDALKCWLDTGKLRAEE